MSIHYENAPISEALIDIQVELPTTVSVETLASIHNRVQDQYPRVDPRIYVQGQLLTGAQVGAVAKQTLMGYAFTSNDEKQVFQARMDGFTFSRLRPYGTWLELRDESRRLWGIYKDAVAPAKTTRIAVRYINQIDIPLPLIDYKDYFRTTPEVSPDLPQGLSGFYMQLKFPQPEFDGMLILTQMAIPPPAPKTSSVVLDLDIFRQTLEGVSEDELWTILEILRNRKNYFFEGCITDKTRQLFGQREAY